MSRDLAIIKRTPVEAPAKRALDNEFLPAALEALETPPNRFARFVLIALAAFVVIALVWAFVGRVEIVASAAGRLAPEGQVKVVQAADLGVVRAIHVADGAIVRMGDPLIELDPTMSAAELEQARQAVSVAQIDAARARALVEAALNQGAGTFLAPEGAPPALVAQQEALVKARIAEHRTARAALLSAKAQRDGDFAMVAAEVAKLEEQLPLAERRLAALRALQIDGLAAGARVDEAEDRVIGMRQDLAIRRAEQVKNRAALDAAASEVSRLDAAFAREALDALSEAEAALALRLEELKKAEDKSSLTLLQSPIDGVVQQLSVHTIGAVVRAADPLLVIVPQGEELVVDVSVLNRDAGFVEVGQPVEVKFEAFPFTRYGVAHGRLERVSRDAVEDEEQGLIYPARVRLSEQWLEINGRRTPLTAGLAATAEIKTGDRRIIDYLLSPLARRVDEAGRER